MKLSSSTGERPLKDVACPVCGAKAVYVQRKACCAQCGWNIDNARKGLWTTIRQGALGFLIAGPIWYVLGGWQSLAFLAVFAAAVTVVAVVNVALQFRKIPRTAARPLAIPEPMFRVLPHPPLARRSNRAWFTGAAVAIASVLFLALFPHDKFIRSQGAGVYAALGAYAFALYILVTHAIALFRVGREWMAESRLARRSEMTLGQVLAQTPNGKGPNTITYQFRDAFNNLRRGSGNDYSDLLFEGMQVAVLYDPDDPAWNLPVCGLNFHLLAREEPVAAS